MRLVEYLNDKGKSPFATWFNRINAQAAARVTTALVRLEAGNTSNAKSVKGGVYELKIDFGPGYRVYFAYDGTEIVILLGGGTKKRQSKAVDIAKTRWADYKARKRKEK